MTIRQLPSARWTVPGTSGGIAAGWYVYTYIPSTTTAKATYTDYTGNTPNSNPIVLDSRGEANIWWDGVYKVLVYTGDKDNGGALVWSQDNYGEGTTSVLQGNFNLVLNGSFEQDTNGDGVPDDWDVVEYTDGEASLDTTDQAHGAQSLKFVSSGTGGGYATSAFFEVEGSKVVPVSFAIKSSVATVHNQVDIVWYTAAQAVVSTTTLYDDTATNPTDWTAYSYSGTAPATARYGKVRVYGCKDDDAQAGTTWFDNVRAEVATALQGWFSSVNGTVTATDEELNILDGATTTTADINMLAEGGALHSASDVLATIKTVDGAGSGLDSDLIKGKHVFCGRSDALPSGWSLTWGTGAAEGRATITHGIGSVVYPVLFLDSNADSVIPYLVTASTNSFTVKISNTYQSPAFSFIAFY